MMRDDMLCVDTCCTLLYVMRYYIMTCGDMR